MNQLTLLCAVCSRAAPKAGMCETCRSVLGYHGEAPELTALADRDKARDAHDTLALCTRLRDQGLHEVADAVLRRVAVVRVELIGGRLAVHCPYSPVFVKAARAIPGRHFDGRGPPVTTFPAAQRALVFAALRLAFPGALGTGPKGGFVL